MAHSSEYSGFEIEILHRYEYVRIRPLMWIGSTDQRGLHSLLQLAVEGLLWQYSRLKHPLSKLTICLEQDGSATLTAEGSAPSAPFWGLSGEGLWRELQRRSSFAFSALCERGHMTLRGPGNQWRSLLFERGVLRGDELHSSCPPGASSDIWLRFWPDFSILQPNTFDYQEVLDLIRPFSETHSDIAITVSDGRSHSV